MKGKPKSKLLEWQKEIRDNPERKCERCGKLRPVSVDHIVPKYLLEMLGLDDVALNDERNFAYLCHPCNKFKGARIDIADEKAVELLKEYVGRL